MWSVFGGPRPCPGGTEGAEGGEVCVECVCVCVCVCVSVCVCVRERERVHVSTAEMMGF